MVDWKKILGGVGVLLIIIFIIFIIDRYQVSDEEFSINPSYPIKLTISQGGSAVSTLKIFNNKQTEENFKIYFNDLEEIASTDYSELTLAGITSKEILLTLNNSNLKPGIHYGKLIIDSSTSSRDVPIAVIVEDPNSVFAIILKSIPRYEEISPGGKLGIELTMFDLGAIFPKKVKVAYSLVDFNKNIIFTSEENLVIEEKYGFSNLFDIPNDTPYGDYMLIVSIDYRGVESISGYLFKVSPETRESSSISEFNLFFWIISFFMAMILALFFYFIKTRDSLFIELKKQQDQELIKNLEAIQDYKSRIKNLETPKKEEKVKKLEESKKVIMKKIKKKHGEQRKEFKKLKKKQGKVSLRKRLDEWKKQGYKMVDTKEELKKFTKQRMNKQLKNWKSQGYNTGFLKR